jgi:endonuclease-3
MRRNKVVDVRRLLLERFGRLKIAAEGDATGELVKTILSQNTSDITSLRAFDNLKGRFRSWEGLRKASLPAIKREIRIAGLSNIKAPRIKGALNEIKKRTDSLSLEFLKDMGLIEGYRFLRSIKGVGPKTAAVVLLFSFGRPIMPVDTHIFRIMKRLGFISPSATREKAQEYLTSESPAHAIKEFHLHLIMLGRQVCTAREPKCPACNLKKMCKYYGDRNGRQGVKDRKKRI